MEQTPDAKIEKYRRDLTFFMNLRSAVKRRYAEVVDFKEYEAKIQKLIDTHVRPGSVEKVTTLVNIFDKDAFLKEMEKLEGAASKADTIAHRTKKTIKSGWRKTRRSTGSSPRCSKMRSGPSGRSRLADRDYLTRVTEIADSIRNRSDSGLPSALRNHDAAKAFYGVMTDIASAHSVDNDFREARPNSVAD